MMNQKRLKNTLTSLILTEIPDFYRSPLEHRFWLEIADSDGFLIQMNMHDGGKDFNEEVRLLQKFVNKYLAGVTYPEAVAYCNTRQMLIDEKRW